MVTICLLRHGETSFNADGNRYCGRTDVELTAKGISQAKKMYELLEEYCFDAVYSSSLQRARKTAEIASGNAKKVLVDDRLIEVDFGEWEGLRPDEFQTKDPESWANWMAAPERFAAGRTGETAMQVISRLQSFYDDLIERYSGKTVLVIGHNGVNRLFLASQLGMPLKNYRRLVQENSALTLLTLSQHQGCQLLKLNA
ncbi:histidine phosphatase family protein [Sphingobacterium chuzhouense]|uniref:Histidine phosphatase family protein n=1 Tax=Sphingobacterium chuzhouense TaxID=1742264 RepID=A0ABR7XVK8_9SPHI|nr:histidine phosphatase family protein [Sphingobacterium chuzhouense]MBD1423083.1 histidine phosphatase family protein [Sphingobacterium chuzhouense]